MVIRTVWITILVGILAAGSAGCIIVSDRRSHRGQGVHHGKHRHDHCHQHKRKRVCHDHPHTHPHH